MSESKGVVHVRPAQTGRDLERHEAEARRWHDRGYDTGPVPDDDQEHPYSVPCPECRVAGASAGTVKIPPHELAVGDYVFDPMATRYRVNSVRVLRDGTVSYRVDGRSFREYIPADRAHVLVIKGEQSG